MRQRCDLVSVLYYIIALSLLLIHYLLCEQHFDMSRGFNVLHSHTVATAAQSAGKSMSQSEETKFIIVNV